MPAIVRPDDLIPDANTPLEPLKPLLHSAGHHYAVLLVNHIWNGLALFAIFTIARQTLLWCVNRRRDWKDRASSSRRRPVALHGPPRFVNQQRLHHRFVQGPHWTMDEKSRGVSKNQNTDSGAVEPGLLKGMRRVGFTDAEQEEDRWTHPMAIDGAPYGPRPNADFTMKRQFMTRPPPPPPLTPPELSTAVFTFDDRRRSYAGTGFGADLGTTSFIHQPNPDYMSSTSTSVSHSAGRSDSLPSTVPRRRSYTKTLPIGIPAPQTTLPMTDVADLVFSPSSYPPTSPLLPPAPPGDDGLPGHEGEIEVQGEVISMMDGHGAGWKRHTRVYGGGVCLACAASGGEGGFYGATVRPEERR